MLQCCVRYGSREPPLNNSHWASKTLRTLKPVQLLGAPPKPPLFGGLLPNLTQGALALYPLWASSLDPLTTSHRAFHSTKIVRIWRNITCQWLWNITCQWLCHTCQWLCHIIATQFQLQSSSILYVYVYKSPLDSSI